MIKIDWNIFETKFNDQTQATFEWLCSILFCMEFNLPQGVSRYKNQPAVEVEPIEYNKDYISFQAKYITIPISNYREKLIQMIKTAKHDYPFIDEELNMYPCSFMIENQEKHSLRKSSILKIWQNSQMFKKIRNELNKEQCNCEYFKICHGGCRIYDINFCTKGPIRFCVNDKVS